MPEIVYYVASSLDGFIATSDGSVAWLDEFAGDEDYGYADFLASVDALLIGSATYEQVLTFGDWPYAGKPTFVFSSRALPIADESVAITAEEPATAARGLDEAGIARAWLVGGGELAGAFARQGLIDRYIVSVMPVLLGQGVPLLGCSGGTGRLRLESSARIGDVVQNTYLSGRRV